VAEQARAREHQNQSTLVGSREDLRFFAKRSTRRSKSSSTTIWMAFIMSKFMSNKFDKPAKLGWIDATGTPRGAKRASASLPPAAPSFLTNPM
jgi:hypothetical protein